MNKKQKNIFLIIPFLFIMSCEDMDQPVDPETPLLTNIKQLNDQSISLHWTHSDSNVTFNVYRSDNNSNYVLRDNIHNFTTHWIDINLIVEKLYYYKISALINKRESDFSNVMTISTVFPGPDMVNTLPVSDNTMKIEWQNPEEYDSLYSVESYNIERRLIEGEYEYLTTVPAMTTVYTDNSVSPDLSYQYRVCAVNKINRSDFTESNINNTQFPGPTSLFISIVNDHSIHLTWADNCSFESGYEIERDAGNGFNLITRRPENSTSYTDEGLHINTDYSYRVRAYTSENVSQYSNIQKGLPNFLLPQI